MAEDYLLTLEDYDSLDPQVQRVLLLRHCWRFLPMMIGLLAHVEPTRNRVLFLHSLRLGLTLRGQIERPDLSWPKVPLFDFKTLASMAPSDNYEHAVSLNNVFESLIGGAGVETVYRPYEGKIGPDSFLGTPIRQTVPRSGMEKEPKEIVRYPLIPVENVEERTSALDQLDKISREESAAQYWTSVVRQLLLGQSIDWPLMREILNISNETWMAGAEAVSKEILEIEKGLKEPSVDPAEASKQVLALYARPGLTSFLCKSISDEILAALKINYVAVEFERLRDLPPVLDLIAELVQSRDRVGELEVQVAEFATKLDLLTRELEKAKGKSRKDLFLDRVTTTSATALTTGFWALLGGGVSHFLGFVDANELVSRFGSAVDGLPLQSPLEEPHHSDGPKFERPPEK